MTQQFDEGMKEIALGLLAIGTAPFSADKIKDFLDKRPEPIEQKIDALDRVEDIMPSSSNFHRVADEYLKQYEKRNANSYTPPEPKEDPKPIVDDLPPEKNEDSAEDCNSTILSSLLKTDGIDFLRSFKSFFNFLSDFSIGNVNGAIIGSWVTSFN